MKNIFFKFLLLMLVLCLCACNALTDDSTNSDTTETSETNTGEETLSAKQTVWYEEVEKAVSSTDYNGWMPKGTMSRLLDEVENVSLTELKSQPGDRIIDHTVGNMIPFADQLSSLYSSIKDFCSVFPTEHIKKIDDEHICVVYSITKEGIGSAFLYVVFERHIYDEIYENWKNTGEFYVVSEKKSLEDFSGIKIGDRAGDIIQLDVGMHIDFVPLTVPNNYSRRILSEGILEIVLDFGIDMESASQEDLLEALNNFENFPVKSIQFYPWNATEVPEQITIINAPHLFDDLP